MSVVSTDVVVRYHINDNVWTVNGYHCLFSRCNPKKLGSLDKLESHIANCHPSLGFTLDMDLTTGDIDESFVDIIIKGGQHESKQRSKIRGGGRGVLEKSDSVIEDFDWVSPIDPNTPLSLQRVLEDRPRWTIGNHHRIRETPPATAFPAFAPVSDIKLELPTRVRHRVPVVPHPKRSNTVAFVSSDNKAALVTDEVLSDEDDGVDEAHLGIARNVQMMEQVLDTSARKFLLDVNAHIESESLQGDKYLGPCMWRWLHKRKAWLKDSAIAKMFEDMVYAAWGKGYMSEEVYKACMDVSQNVRNDPSIRGYESRSPREGLPSARRAKDSCSCGKSFTSVRDRIACSNKVKSPVN